jgi:hypothetical protein
VDAVVVKLRTPAPAGNRTPAIMPLVLHAHRRHSSVRVANRTSGALVCIPGSKNRRKHASVSLSVSVRLEFVIRTRWSVGNALDLYSGGDPALDTGCYDYFCGCPQSLQANLEI